MASVKDYFAPPSAAEITLQKRVYTEISLTCHGWKVDYFALYPGGFPLSNDPSDKRDIWELMLDTPHPPYSEQAWNRYRPLFTSSISSINDELQETLAAHSDWLPSEVRTLIIVTKSQLDFQQRLFVNYQMFGQPEESAFARRIKSTIMALKDLDDEVQRLRDES